MTRRLHNGTIRFFTGFLAAVFIAAIGLFFGMSGMVAYAATPTTDGTYSVPVNLELKMGKEYFSSSATVEKSGDTYYMTFGYDSGTVSSLVYESGNAKVGMTEKKDGDWVYYTYTMSYGTITSKMNFTAHIPAMPVNDGIAKFTLTLNMSAATKTSDTIDTSFEHPAEYVPVITTDASAEYGAQSGLGHYFIIPSATAKLGNDDCSVTASVTLNGEAVEVSDGKFMTETPGNYILTYRAESDKYKTSEGNNTFAEYVVTVRATAEASEIAKFADSDKVPDGLALLVGIARSGSTVYEKASKAMKTVSLKYDVFTVELIGAGGIVISELDENVEIDLKANMTIDRTKAEVYRLKEDGGIEKISAKGVGRYVRVEMNKGGTYIVCEPGIPFVMPMWGYCIIIVGCILIASVSLIFILKARNKKRMAANAERKDETENISENI